MASADYYRQLMRVLPTNTSRVSRARHMYSAAFMRKERVPRGYEHMMCADIYSYKYANYVLSRPFPAGEVSLDHDTEDWYRRDIIDHSR